MTPKDNTKNSYYYGQYEGYELRCQRRLQKDLGVDEAAAEAILRLRKQIIELQSYIHHLETELAIQQAIQDVHLASYREVEIEATWIELDFQD